LYYNVFLKICQQLSLLTGFLYYYIYYFLSRFKTLGSSKFGC
jgi:hypothetical protein